MCLTQRYHHLHMCLNTKRYWKERIQGSKVSLALTLELFFLGNFVSDFTSSVLVITSTAIKQGLNVESRWFGKNLTAIVHTTICLWSLMTKCVGLSADGKKGCLRQCIYGVIQLQSKGGAGQVRVRTRVTWSIFRPEKYGVLSKFYTVGFSCSSRARPGAGHIRVTCFLT